MFDTTGFEDRLAIASQAPVEVYAPSPARSGEAGENTGDWWPYRRETVAEACESTSDRCLKYLVDIAGHMDAISTTDLYRRADQFNATYALQRPMAGVASRHPSRTATLTHEATDYKSWKTTPILPIPAPHGRTRDFLEQATPEVVKNAAISLVGLRHTPPHEQIQALRAFRETAGTAATVFLVDIVPTAPFVRELADAPHLADAILLSDDTERLVANDDPAYQKTVSDRGAALLQDGMSPTTQVAAQLSYILSPLCEPSEVDRAIEQSAIPESPSETSVSTSAAEVIDHTA